MVSCVWFSPCLRYFVLFVWIHLNTYQATEVVRKQYFFSVYDFYFMKYQSLISVVDTSTKFEIYQVLPSSVDFNAPGKLWNPLSKTVLSKRKFIWDKGPVNILNNLKFQKQIVHRNCKYSDTASVRVLCHVWGSVLFLLYAYWTWIWFSLLAGPAFWVSCKYLFYTPQTNIYFSRHRLSLYRRRLEHHISHNTPTTRLKLRPGLEIVKFVFTKMCLKR